MKRYLYGSKETRLWNTVHQGVTLLEELSKTETTMSSPMDRHEGPETLDFGLLGVCTYVTSGVNPRSSRCHPVIDVHLQVEWNVFETVRRDQLCREKGSTVSMDGTRRNPDSTNPSLLLLEETEWVLDKKTTTNKENTVNRTKTYQF